MPSSVQQTGRRSVVPGAITPGTPGRPAPDAPEREGSRPAARRKLRGLLVGKIPAEDILTWEDFEATHRANVAAAERRYGVLDA